MKYLYLLVLVIVVLCLWSSQIPLPTEPQEETFTGKVVLIKSDYILVARCNGETCSPPVKVKIQGKASVGDKIVIIGKWDGDIFISTESYVSNPDLTLIRVGRNWPVQSITTGQQNVVLQRMAEAKAAEQARVQIQSHSGWDTRVVQLYREVPECGEFAEVVNESWPGQDTEQAAREMYNSWKQSTGHWAAVDGKCDYYGYSMVRGSNGIWYACGIFGYARNK